MTDITALAQREKFEAWFVNDVVGADVNFPAFKDGEYTEGEIYDEQLYFMLQAMWMAWKAAGAELVEALEYYKSREERVTSLVRDNSKSWDELYRQVEAKGKRNVELVEALESEKRICATWRKTAEANSEKLEKAQQQMTESENRVRKQNRHICELFDDNTALRQRIAELESRTVKMPKPHAHLIWIQAGHAPDDYWDDVAVSHSEKDRCCDGSERYPVYARWEIEEMLAAAGIKVEAD
ncbi:TPA: hypothetical protein ACWMA9_004885 [Klebsiella pneumoniae]